VVFELSDQPFPQPRACHLDAEVARVLPGRVGWKRGLTILLTVSDGMEYVDDRASARRLFTFEGFEREPLLGWHEDYVFIQPEIDALLRSALREQTTVEVHLGVEAPDLDVLLPRPTGWWPPTGPRARAGARSGPGSTSATTRSGRSST
jgi:2-polyprenyl-6-methoxyphenol hydroxylase-like FAD-dependent oxidoreductase